MENKRKKYIRIESDISNDELFAMFDEIDSGDESDIENILNDSDTEFLCDKPITTMANDIHKVLVPEANFHVASEATEQQQEEYKVVQKKRKSQPIFDIKWSSKRSSQMRRDCLLKASVQHDFGENFTPVDVFMKVVNAQTLIEHIVSETNLYASQKGRTFLTNYDELKAFLGINYFMGINKLPSVASYWGVEQYIGNDGIKNVMTRQRFQDILQNLHFANNEKDDKSDKGK